MLSLFNLPRRPIRILAVFCVLSVAVLSLTPQIGVPSSAPPKTDLVLHLLMHGPMAGLIALGWPRHLLAVLVTVLGLAIGFEAAQHVIPGRSFSPADMAMNLIGGALGLTLGRWLSALALRRSD